MRAFRLFLPITGRLPGRALLTVGVSVALGLAAIVSAPAAQAAAPHRTAHAQTVDPSLPVPTLPANAPGCGSSSEPAWTTPAFEIDLAQKMGNGYPLYQAAVHAWDLDGSQTVDALGTASLLDEQQVYVPLNLVNGHTYAWYASTFDGTDYSSATPTCYFNADTVAPSAPVITDPDFPATGTGGTPTKSQGQPTTFTFSSSDPLPSGCTAAGTPDCAVSGLDHFIYWIDDNSAIGGQGRVPANSDGMGSLTTSFTWGTHTLYVASVDAAGNQYNQSSYSFYVPSQLAPPLGPDTGTFHAVTPTRLLDTRSSGKLVPTGGTTGVQIQGNAKVPGMPSTGVNAVVLNLTTTQTTGSGFLTAYADGTKRPTTSNLNWTGARQTVSNLVTVPVAADGRVDFYTSSSAAVIADIQGYYTNDSNGLTYLPLTPDRILDTRSAVGIGSRTPVSNSTITLDTTGGSTVPDSGATAVVLNLTVTGTKGAGYLEAYPQGTSAPGVSNINWTASDSTIAGLVIAPVSASGQVSIMVHGTSQVIADVVGYYSPGTGGASFTSVAPSRLLDTRSAIGVGTKSLIPAGHTIALQVIGEGDVPAGAKAVVLNVTVTQTSGSGNLTAWADGNPMPGVSNLNWGRGATVPNQIIAPIGADGKVDLHVTSTTAVIADVFGYFQ